MTGEFKDTALVGNEQIEEAIHRFYQEQTPERFMDVCLAIRKRIAENGHLLFPVHMDEIGALLLNPWGESFCLGKEDIAVILNQGVEHFL